MSLFALNFPYSKEKSTYTCCPCEVHYVLREKICLYKQHFSCSERVFTVPPPATFPSPQQFSCQCAPRLSESIVLLSVYCPVLKSTCQPCPWPLFTFCRDCNVIHHSLLWTWKSQTPLKPFHWFVCAGRGCLFGDFPFSEFEIVRNWTSLMRSGLFWDIMCHCVVVVNRCFGTTSQSHLKGQESKQKRKPANHNVGSILAGVHGVVISKHDNSQ
jgi:hypothetical protein